MATVQFYVGRWMGVKSSVHGYVVAGNEGLQLVLHDGKMERSLLDEETRTIALPWSDLADLSCDHGMLESVLTIRLVTPPLRDDVPGLEGATMTLRVQRKDRDVLDGFVQRALALRRGEQDPDVGDLLDDVSDFLDGI